MRELARERVARFVGQRIREHIREACASARSSNGLIGTVECAAQFGAAEIRLQRTPEFGPVLDLSGEGTTWPVGLNDGITTHYSQAGLSNLIDATNRVCGERSHEPPAITRPKRKSG